MTVAITDPFGGTAQVAANATVADAPLTATALAVSATEGAAFSGLVAEFTDADPDAVPADYTVTIAWGDGATSAGTVAYDSALGAFTVTGAHTYVRAGGYTAAVSITDSGGSTASVTDAVTVADAPLTATALAVTATEGVAFSGLVASFTDADPDAVPADYTADYRLGRRHRPPPARSPTTRPSAPSPSPVRTPTTTWGAIRSRSPSPTTAAPRRRWPPAPPSPSSAPPPSPSRPPRVPPSAVWWRSSPTPIPTPSPPTSRRPSPGATAQTSAGSIAYDGALGAFTVTGSHTYDGEGSYVVTVAIADAGGATAQVATTATVADVPPTATALAVAATEGAAFSGLVAEFTDVDPEAVATDFIATIAWGDGATSAGTVGYDSALGTFTVAGTHTYDGAGSYVVTVAIADYGGATTQVAASATVADVSPSGSGVAVSATEGAAFSGLVAEFTDVDPEAVAADFTATIAWGDGATSAGTVGYDSALGTFTVAGTHTYDGAGSYAVTVAIADPFGGTAEVSATATVADVSPSATAVAVSATEGAAFRGLVAEFTDVDPEAVAADFTATIAWGDGADLSRHGRLRRGPRRLHRHRSPHLRPRRGLFGRGLGRRLRRRHGERHRRGHRRRRAPDASPVAVSATEGAAFSGVVAWFTDADPEAVAADFTATIAWGDGATSAGTVAYDAALGAFTVTGAHTYARAGAYSAAVSVAGSGGGTASVTDAVTVADALLERLPRRRLGHRGRRLQRGGGPVHRC